MKAILHRHYRNDKFALSMIEFYLRRFAGYDEAEQAHLKRDEDALCIDFESWLESLGEEPEAA